MTFAHPSVLWMIAGLVPALALFFWWSWRERQRLIALFVPRRLQESLTAGLSPGRATARAVLLLAALVALALALARPRLGMASIEVSQRGLDILVGIDTSRSMLAEDAGPGVSRLQRARLAALDLARLARTDRVGLIAFAGSAFLQCPLTIDDEAFRQSVEALDTDIIPQGGTSLASALDAALETLNNEKNPPNVRVLVLFTDGEEHERGALEAARSAARQGLKVFPVGIGTARGEIIRVRDAQGNSTYLKDDQGNVVKSTLNEPLLREIAEATGGFYVPLQGPRAIQELYARGLEPLPRSELAARQIEQYLERFQWPLALALVLLVWESLLPERARPRGAPRPVRLAHPTLAGSATPAILLVGLLLFPAAGFASPRSALRAYQEGRYNEAEREYDRLAREHPDDVRLRFNAGTAAYRGGEFQRAAGFFSESLRSPDLQLQRDAYHNLGNSLFATGAQIPDPAARQKLWEQSLQSFDSALKLNPDDPATRHNHDFVRRELEELRQQQQEQKQQQPNPSDSRKDQDQEKDQDQNQPSDQDQAEDKNPSVDRNQPSDSDRQDPSQEQEENPPDQPSQDNQDQAEPRDSQSRSKSDNDSSSPRDDARTNPQSAADQADAEARPGQMTPQQALRLLDSVRGEERPLPLEKKRARARVLKDW